MLSQVRPKLLRPSPTLGLNIPGDIDSDVRIRLELNKRTERFGPTVLPKTCAFLVDTDLCVRLSVDRFVGRTAYLQPGTAADRYFCDHPLGGRRASRPS